MKIDFDIQQLLVGTIEDEIKRRAALVPKVERVIQLFIKAGGDLNITDGNGRSLLLLAVQADHQEMVKAILNSLTDPTVQQSSSSSNDPVQTESCLTSALLFAIESKKWGMVRLLMNGVNAVGRDFSRVAEKRDDLFYNVTQSEDHQLIKLLWDQGVRATPALNRVINEGRDKLVDCIARAGVKLNSADVSNGLHPLFTALFVSEDNLVKLMYSITETENVEKFLFDLASNQQKVLISKFWQCINPDPGLLIGILSRAANEGSTQVFETLKETDLLADQLGQCLHDACFQGKQKVVEALLKIDVDLNRVQTTPVQFLYDVALKNQAMARMVLNAWQSKANKNCPVIISQALDLAKQHNDERSETVSAFLNSLTVHDNSHQPSATIICNNRTE